MTCITSCPKRSAARKSIVDTGKVVNSSQRREAKIAQTPRGHHKSALSFCVNNNKTRAVKIQSLTAQTQRLTKPKQWLIECNKAVDENCD